MTYQDNFKRIRDQVDRAWDLLFNIGPLSEPVVGNPISDLLQNESEDWIDAFLEYVRSEDRSQWNAMGLEEWEVVLITLFGEWVVIRRSKTISTFREMLSEGACRSIAIESLLSLGTEDRVLALSAALDTVDDLSVDEIALMLVKLGVVKTPETVTFAQALRDAIGEKRPAKAAIVEEYISQDGFF